MFTFCEESAGLFLEEQLRRPGGGGEFELRTSRDFEQRLLHGFPLQNLGQDRLMQSTQRTFLNQNNHHFL